MFAGLKRCPEMKDSGVDWLGKIPALWAVTRLKSSVRNIVGRRLNPPREMIDEE